MRHPGVPQNENGPREMNWLGRPLITGAVNLPAFGIPSFGIPDFGVPGFGIPGFGISGSGRVPSRYRPKGVFGKGVGDSQNASEMRQKCVRNASKWVLFY